MKKQHGFGIIEFLVVIAISLILIAIATPSAMTVMNIIDQKAAKDRVSRVWQLRGAYSACMTLTPTQCAPIAVLLPPEATPVKIGPYTYVFTTAADSSWSLVATPNRPLLSVVSLSSNGPLMCGAVTCQ
jgi:prepilin-type N-terminal cleavage/methylation domain-containing protein